MEQRSAFHPGLLVRLLRQPVWVASWLADGVAIVLQALALRLGSVPLVQAVIVGGLPVAVVLRARALPARRDMLGLLLTCAGIVAVVVTLPGEGRTAEAIRTRLALLAVTDVSVLVVLLVAGGAAAARAGRRHLDGLAVGTAAGVSVGSAAVPLALAVRRLPHLPAVLGSWPLWLAVAAGAVGLLLSQAAFQRGALAAPLAALTLAEPVTASVLAAALLHVPLSRGLPGTAVLAVGAAAAALGVVLLAPRAA